MLPRYICVYIKFVLCAEQAQFIYRESSKFNCNRFSYVYKVKCKQVKWLPSYPFVDVASIVSSDGRNIYSKIIIVVWSKVKYTNQKLGFIRHHILNSKIIKFDRCDIWMNAHNSETFIVPQYKYKLSLIGLTIWLYALIMAYTYKPAVFANFVTQNILYAKQ